MMRLELATAEYIGARAQQQDLAAAVPLQGGAVLVLADGLGGHESGAEASRIVVETFKEASGQGLFDSAEFRRQALRDTVEKANQRIANGVDPAHGQRGMASTVVAAVVAGGELIWVSVGDSHLYVWRGGRLAKLNEDHSQAGLMVRSGQYKTDDPEVQAVRSVLVSALTGRKLEIVDLPSRAFQVESGDVLMLASDGLNTLEDDEIGQIVANVHAEGAVRLSTVLLETVRGRRVDRQDNTTVAIARVLAAPGRSERDATARTVTHQVTVPTDVTLEPRTEVAAAPASAQPAPPRSPAETAKAANDAPAPDRAAAPQEPVKPVEAGPREPERPAAVAAKPGPAAVAAKPRPAAIAQRLGLDAPVVRPPAAAPRSADEGPNVPTAAPLGRRGGGLTVLSVALIWLLAALVALGAIAMVRPEWLPGLGARNFSGEPLSQPGASPSPSAVSGTRANDTAPPASGKSGNAPVGRPPVVLEPAASVPAPEAQSGGPQVLPPTAAGTDSPPLVEPVKPARPNPNGRRPPPVN